MKAIKNKKAAFSIMSAAIIGTALIFMFVMFSVAGGIFLSTANPATNDTSGNFTGPAKIIWFLGGLILAVIAILVALQALKKGGR